MTKIIIVLALVLLVSLVSGFRPTSSSSSSSLVSSLLVKKNRNVSMLLAGSSNANQVFAPFEMSDKEPEKEGK